MKKYFLIFTLFFSASIVQAQDTKTPGDIAGTYITDKVDVGYGTTRQHQITIYKDLNADWQWTSDYTADGVKEKTFFKMKVHNDSDLVNMTCLDKKVWDSRRGETRQRRCFPHAVNIEFVDGGVLVKNGDNFGLYKKQQ